MIRRKANGRVPVHVRVVCMGNKGKPTDIPKFTSGNGFLETYRIFSSELGKHAVSAITNTH
jgi:hypothetical protein